MITNTVTGDIYVGSSVNIESRCLKHQSLLRKGAHQNKHLQSSWDKYERGNFAFSILEKCEYVKEILLAREQYYIKSRHPQFNKNPLATSNLGCTWTLGLVAREHMKAAQKGKIHSLEAREAMSKTRKRIGLTPEQLEAMRIGRIGIKRKPPSQETRAKMSAWQKGKPKQGRPCSEEAKRKMSATKRERNLPNPRLGVHLSDETKKKIRAKQITCQQRKRSGQCPE